MKAPLSERGFDRDGAFTLGLATLVSLLGLGLPVLFAVAHVLRHALARPHSSANATHPAGRHALLVFGKRLIQGQPDGDYRDRLATAHALIQSQQAIKLAILLGGNTAQGGTPSEARAGLLFLEQIGHVDPVRIRLEEDSTNTLENLRNARALLRDEQIDTCLLLSNRYHLARCATIASSLGMAHETVPAENNIPIGAGFLFRVVLEALWLTWFQTGKTWARLTRNQRMLKRVS